MFSFRTSPLAEQLDKALRDGRVAVMESEASWDVGAQRYCSDIFRARGNLVEGADLEDPAVVDGLSAIVVDIQDAGCRLFPLTRKVVALMNLLHGMELRQEDGYGVPSLYIVDHPNPAGRIVEGSMPAVRELSDIPGTALRHGLTLGELCHLHYADIGGRFGLHILSADASANTTLVMPWVIPPSEDLPGLFSCNMLPGGSLWEYTSVTPGIGTARPYELIGAPFISPGDVPPCPEGLSMRPCRFTPLAGKYAGTECRGWQIILLPGREYHSLLHTLQLMRHLGERYSQFEYGPGFSEALGDPVAEAYLKGEITFDIVEESIKAEEQKWIRKAKRFCLYDDPPFRIK